MAIAQAPNLDSMVGTLLDEAKWGTSGYYRNPLGFREGRESLWIAVDETSDARHVLQKINSGYQFLNKYGAAPGFGAPNREGRRRRTSTELWTPILSSAEGRAEFPADQVKAMRWQYPMDKNGNGRGCQSLHGKRLLFPQLLEALRNGDFSIEVTPCPECNNRTFYEPWHLARHLRNTHDYDPKMIFDLGEAIGVDFKKTIALIFQGQKTEGAYEDAEFDNVGGDQSSSYADDDEMLAYAKVNPTPPRSTRGPGRPRKVEAVASTPIEEPEEDAPEPGAYA